MDSLTELMKQIRANAPKKPKVYECEKCRDSGIIFYTDENGREVARGCECEQVRRAKKILEASGISEEFREMGFNGYDTRGLSELEGAKAKAVDYYKTFKSIEKNRSNSILLCGQVGAGKTHLGIAIANNLMSCSIAVVYMPYRNVVTQLKQNITDEDTYQYELNKYMRARVLFIDDMLKGRITETDVNIMYELINYRYMNHKPLIISTEKLPSELIEFDEATGSRIIEMCREHIVLFEGTHLNYRLR